jgi:hypothetical protein
MMFHDVPGSVLRGVGSPTPANELAGAVQNDFSFANSCDRRATDYPRLWYIDYATELS